MVRKWELPLRLCSEAKSLLTLSRLLFSNAYCKISSTCSLKILHCFAISSGARPWQDNENTFFSQPPFQSSCPR